MTAAMRFSRWASASTWVEPVAEELAVGQVGQGVVGGSMAEEFLRLLLRRDVHEDARVVGGPAAFVLDDAERQPGRVRFAVLAAVPDLSVPSAGLGQRGPHLAVELLVVQAGLEQADVLPDDFFGRVAGDGGEGLVDGDDLALRIGDHDSFRGALEDFGRQAGALLHALPADRLVNHRGQQVQVDRLGILDDVVVRAQFHRFHGGALVAGAGDHDDRRQGTSRAEPADDLQSVIDRHRVVQGHHVVQGRHRTSPALFSVGGQVHGVAGPLERLRQRRARPASSSIRRMRTGSFSIALTPGSEA